MRVYLSSSGLYILGLATNDTGDNLVQSPLNRQGVTLERALTPPNFVLLVGDLDEQPAGLHPEVLDRLDLDHD